MPACGLPLATTYRCSSTGTRSTFSIRPPKRRSSSSAGTQPQFVTHAPDRKHVFRGGWVALDLLTQVPDVHLQHLRVALEVRSPGEVQQVVVGDYFAGI